MLFAIIIFGTDVVCCYVQCNVVWPQIFEPKKRCISSGVIPRRRA